MDEQTATAQRTTRADRPHRRTGAGIAAGLVVLLLVAVPAFWTGWFALAAFSGCFIECGDPEPAVGALWGGITLVLLALPLATGVAVARVPLARGWPWFLGAAALLGAVALLAQRVV